MRARLAALAVVLAAAALPANAGAGYTGACSGIVDVMCEGMSCEALDCFWHDCLVWADASALLGGEPVCVEPRAST